MHQTNADLSPDERRREIAAILARRAIRLRLRGARSRSESAGKDLDRRPARQLTTWGSLGERF
jgi:hypothetical protein